MIANRPDWALGVGDDEGGQCLVGDLRILLVEGLYGLGGGGKGSSVAEYVTPPPSFDHVPFRFVTVHGDTHSASPRSDIEVPSTGFMGGQTGFQARNVVHGRSGGHIATVGQDVDEESLNSVECSPVDQRDEMVDVTVDIPVGHQADQMECGALDQLLPHGRVPGCAVRDGLVDEFGSLIKYAACTDGVVSDLAVPHVFGAGQSNRRAVGRQGKAGMLMEIPVEIGCVRTRDRVIGTSGTQSNAVHDAKYDRPRATDKMRMRWE